ncbi:hypothetical protein ACFVJS_03650 [Nocardioides sp. NPDC057772]|uniref:hypothetical protein n=1 Tax=Nocardioides sp. NPDC057772 TaxID=3346245 RepID=UPI00366C06D0
MSRSRRIRQSVLAVLAIPLVAIPVATPALAVAAISATRTYAAEAGPGYDSGYGSAYGPGEREVIGMNVAATSGSAEISGYAIPIDTVLDIAAQIIAGEESGDVEITTVGGTGVASIERHHPGPRRPRARRRDPGRLDRCRRRGPRHHGHARRGSGRLISCSNRRRPARRRSPRRRSGARP